MPAPRYRIHSVSDISCAQVHIPVRHPRYRGGTCHSQHSESSHPRGLDMDLQPNEILHKFRNHKLYAISFTMPGPSGAVENLGFWPRFQQLPQDLANVNA